MANDGQIVFEVTADGKHAIADIKEITRVIQQESGKWDTAAKESTDGISNKFSGMLTKLAAGFSAVKIGKALIDLGKQAVDAASDLREVQNVVDVTFGEDSNKIEKWAKAAGDQFGLTETKAKQFSSTMGAMLKSAGLAGEQIVGVSTDLAGLAADMASFYNLDFDEAFAKIRSGISGQTMPLKELGIDMSVATLNAFALSQGLEKTFDKMSQGEQVMLRYQYLMSATADAQGDFARTSDGYANAMRNLESKVDSLKTLLGGAFLGVVEQATLGLTEFLKLLLPDESKRTVLDDFADIDLKTEEKLENIRATAEEARLLTEQLDEIGGSKASQAGSAVQQMVEGLSKINLNQGKAGIVKEFISTLAQDIPTLAALQGTDENTAAAWLEQVSTAANNLNENDAKGWETLLNTIKEGLPGIENTDFGAKFFAALGAGFNDVSQQSTLLQWAVDTLGDKTNRTAEQQALWLETCKRLVQTIPGLSSIINTETGEVKGGTQAVKDYIKAWEEGQTKLAMTKALEEKETALSQRFSDLPGLQLDMALAQRRVRQQAEKIRQLYKQYGVREDLLPVGEKINTITGYYKNMNIDNIRVINGAVDELEKLKTAETEATEAYQRQADALEEGEKALEEYKQTVAEMPGEINQTNTAQKSWLETIGKTADEVKKLADDAQSAMTELADYAQSIHDGVEKSVDSMVSGFEKIETPMDKNRQKVKDLEKSITDLDSTSKTYEDDLKKINDEIAKQRGEQISAQSMGKNLEQQAQYMEKYLENLRKARSLGISNEVLASLSDGSGESYDYLEQLAKATPSEVKTINDNYQKVIDKKKELTDELSKQQLSADKTYQTLAEKAKQAIESLDLEEEAKNNAGKTVQGVAEGVASHLDEVQTAVDSIIAEVNRLAGLGISVNTDNLGSISLSTTSERNAQRNAHGTQKGYATGIDYVPKDMLARIHEGETILRREEASVYRAIKSGANAGVDMDTLGGVMRDNVKGGGNVYLDGKIVGNVISDRQGRSYKAMQRSGWQA